MVEPKAYWVVPFCSESMLWTLIPHKNDNALRVRQTMCLMLEMAPNEFEGHLRNQHLLWDMLRQQVPLGCLMEMYREITFMEM